MESNNYKKIELNPDSLKILKIRIYNMERENHTTTKYKATDRVDRIRKLIEAEVDKIGN